MQRMLAILLALLATTSSAFEPRHISNNELRTEKLGRIVDAATGAGIPDAKVIAVWGALAADASGSGYMCQLQRIATTDAAGNYVIPDVSHDLDLSRRGTGGLHTPMGIGYHSLDFDWHLMVFKPGYVRVGDMEAFKKPVYGEVHFAWEGEYPSVSSSGRIVLMKPIAMQQVTLEPQDEIVYYARLLHAAQCTWKDREQPDFHAIQSNIAKRTRMLPCALPASWPIDESSFKDYTRVAADQALARRIERLTGTTFPWKDTTAGVLCRAASSKEKTP